MVVGLGELAALVEVAPEGCLRRGVQGNEAALAELRPLDPQNAPRQHVAGAQSKCLGKAQASGGDQPKQRGIGLLAQHT